MYRCLLNILVTFAKIAAILTMLLMGCLMVSFSWRQNVRQPFFPRISRFFYSTAISIAINGISKLQIFGYKIRSWLAFTLSEYFKANETGIEDNHNVETFKVEFINKNVSVVEMEFEIERANWSLNATPAFTFLSVNKKNVFDCRLHIYEKDQAAEMVAALDSVHSLFVPDDFDFYLITRRYRGTSTTKIQRTKPTSVLSYFSPHVPTTAFPLRIDLHTHEDNDPVEIFFHNKDVWNFLLVDNVFDQTFLTFFFTRFVDEHKDNLSQYVLTIIDECVNLQRFTEKDRFSICSPFSTADSSMFFRL